MAAKIEKFDPLSASERLWNASFGLNDGLYAEIEPGEPLPPREKRRAMTISGYSMPYSKKLHFLLFPENRPDTAAGQLILSLETPKSPSYEQNRHVCHLNISVLKEDRNKGYGTALVKKALEEVSAFPYVTEFLTGVSLEEGKSFLKKLGGTVSLEQAENRLYFSGLDWKMVETWAEEGAARNPDVKIIRTGAIPQEDLEDFCGLYTETMNQQPLGDVSIRIKYTPEMIRAGEEKAKKDGAEHVTLYSRGSDGSISGLTEIYYLPEVGHKASQMLTGVRESCRGRGIGKWLKAAMLLHIREKYPSIKYLTTANADSNAPMMAINSKLGFKRHRAFLVCKLKIAEIKLA